MVRYNVFRQRGVIHTYRQRVGRLSFGFPTRLYKSAVRVIGVATYGPNAANFSFTSSGSALPHVHTLYVLSRCPEEYSEGILQLLEHNAFGRLECKRVTIEHALNHTEYDTVAFHQIDRAPHIIRNIATVAFVIKIMVAERKNQTTAAQEALHLTKLIFADNVR
jgi:hypothetical protein